MLQLVVLTKCVIYYDKEKKEKSNVWLNKPDDTASGGSFPPGKQDIVKEKIRKLKLLTHVIKKKLLHLLSFSSQKGDFPQPYQVNCFCASTCLVLNISETVCRHYSQLCKVF